MFGNNSFKLLAFTLLMAGLGSGCGKFIYDQVPDFNVDAPNIPTTICVETDKDRRPGVVVGLQPPEGDETEPADVKVTLTDTNDAGEEDFREELLVVVSEDNDKIVTNGTEKFKTAGAFERASSVRGYTLTVEAPNFEPVTLEGIVVVPERENEQQESCHVRTETVSVDLVPLPDKE